MFIPVGSSPIPLSLGTTKVRLSTGMHIIKTFQSAPHVDIPCREADGFITCSTHNEQISQIVSHCLLFSCFFGKYSKKKHFS